MSGIRLILRLKIFVSNGLFVTGWRTFLSCDCVKGGEEYLGLDECRLKMMSGELKEAKSPTKMANEPQSLRGGWLSLFSAEVLMLL